MLGITARTTILSPRNACTNAERLLYLGASAVLFGRGDVAVFVLRRARPEAVRPYRAWGYPVLPGVFVVAYVFVLTSMFWAAPVECSTGLLLIALGMILYGVATRGERSA